MPVKSQVYLTEGFEIGAKPEGWTEEFTSGTEPWRYRNGGHSPNDNNWQVPPDAVDITRNPPSAYDGTYNAIFFKQGDDNEKTKLITPPLNLLGGASIELSFYLCQIPWYFEGSTGWDVLRVYYKVSESSPWILLHEYLDPVYEWEKQTLVLPNPSATYYVAFEGHTRWGYGTCVDDISIESKGFQPMWIKEIDFQQPFPNYVPSGSKNVPVMRVDFTLYGNTGEARLNNINFASLNTSDNDIQINGVKLYSTTSQTFSTENPLGTSTNFSSGIATFSGLNHILPPGHSYLWLTYDLNVDIPYGHILDAKVPANSIFANDTLYPDIEQSPFGSITVYTTRYFENFDGSHNWDVTGEFEVAAPTGLGGSPGNPDPESAYSGTSVLGTDLTGLGGHPYNYEPDLSETTSYLATSPAIDMFYYKNLNMFFQRYLNIEVWDSANIQLSTDNGVTWNNIWNNQNSWVSDFRWTQQQIMIPDNYSRTKQLKLRYQLGPTDIEDNYSGWNIDDVYLTAEFITKDVGVSDWIYPLSGSGHSSNDSVKVLITNYGGAVITDPVPVAYSFNGGSSWVVNVMDKDIPVGGSVTFTFPTKVNLSVPGLKPAVLAETRLPGDQYDKNDRFSTEIYIIPTYNTPYLENFEAGEGFWRSLGNEIWEYGTPAGTIINSASSGSKSWVTGLTEKYGDILTQKNKIIFEDDFETDLGWTFSGEFERDIPNYAYLPYFAPSGYYCIGTDLSGRGTHPFNYENGISAGSLYGAVSPAFDVSNYSNLKVSFLAWITVQTGDSIKLEVSEDNGTNWHTIWRNNEGAISDVDFDYREFSLPDSLSNTNLLRFRFALHHSSASGPVAQGWSIDDFLLTGDLVNAEEGDFTSPSFNLKGLAAPIFETRLWQDTEQDVDGASLFYSLDDGFSWSPVSNISVFDSYWNWYTGKPVEALGMDGWSGHSSGWLTARHLLPPALINKENVQFRFRFMADKSINQYDGIGIDDIKIYEAPHDAGVTEIISPVTACELANDQRFTLRLKNYGIRDMQIGDSIIIGYQVNRAGLIQTGQETIYLSQALAAGGTRDYTMTSEFDFSSSGEYETKVFTIENDPFFYQPVSNDTIYRLIRVNKPAIDLGPDISTVRPDTVILKAYSGVPGYSYKWQDGSVDSIFHVITQGTYYVRVTNDIGCVATDTIQVTKLIADVGVSTLIGPLSACALGKQEQVLITIKNFGTDTVDINDSIFIYRDINSIVLKDTLVIKNKLSPDSTFNYICSENYDFSVPGIYKMKLYTGYRDDYRTNNDTLNYTLEVYGYPDIDLGRDTTLNAAKYVLTASPGYFSYLWQDGSISNTFTVDKAGYGLYYVTVNNDHQCESKDTVRVTLNMTDVEIGRILSPETSCDLSETVTVAVRIRNSGNQIIPAGNKIILGYMVDGGSLQKDSITLSKNFLPADSIDFEFLQKAQVVTGQWYDFTVFTKYSGDIKSWNDTIMLPVGVFESPVVDLGEDYKVVTALEYILDAGPGFASYLWQDGSIGQTFKITKPGINACKVIVTDHNGCTASDEIDIMLAVPDIGVTEIVNPKTSCSLGINENVKVAIKNLGNWDIEKSATISVAYSINSKPAVIENLNLNATFENGSVIYFTFSQTEDLHTPGTYEIEAATIYGSDFIPSNDTVKTNFTIYGNPVVDIGGEQDTILTYDPVILSANPGFASYWWQDGSTNTSYQINYPGAGLYSVIVTDTNGCTAKDSVYVAFDKPDMALSRIVTPVSSCKLDADIPVSIELVNNGFYRIPGDELITITYTVNNGTPVVEERNLGNVLQPGTSKILTFNTKYDFSLLDSYQLDVSVEYGPDENPANNTLSSIVNVWGYPEVEIGEGKDTIKTSLPMTLDAGTGYSSYLWQDGSTGSTFKVTQWNLYWVTVTDENGCPARDSVYVYSPYQINDIQLFPGRVKIYPNPVDYILHFSIELELPAHIITELYNHQGILIKKEDYKRTENFIDEIDFSRKAAGLYFLKIIVDDIAYTYPVVAR